MRSQARKIEPVSLFASGNIEDTDLGSSQRSGRVGITYRATSKYRYGRYGHLKKGRRPPTSQKQMLIQKRLSKDTVSQIHGTTTSRRQNALPFSWVEGVSDDWAHPDIPKLFLLVHFPIRSLMISSRVCTC